MPSLRKAARSYRALAVTNISSMFQVEYTAINLIYLEIELL